MQMKKITFSLFITACILLSCKEPEFRYSERVERIKVDFFLSVGPSKTLLPSFKRGNLNENGSWEPLLFPIKRFEYKPGYIYDLLVVRKNGPMPATPGAVDYKLIKVVSIKKVDKSVPFTLYLKLTDQNYVTGDIHKGYKLLDQIDIDCNNNCFQLENALKTSKTLKGNFVSNENRSIKLLDVVVVQ
jgi:hypothetical protein